MVIRAWNILYLLKEVYRRLVCTASPSWYVSWLLLGVLRMIRQHICRAVGACSIRRWRCWGCAHHLTGLRMLWLNVCYISNWHWRLRWGWRVWFSFKHWKSRLKCCLSRDAGYNAPICSILGWRRWWSQWWVLGVAMGKYCRGRKLCVSMLVWLMGWW